MTADPYSRSLSLDRRRFMATSAGMTAAGLAALASIEELAAAETRGEAERNEPLIQPGQTVLFQGDSITDAGRNRALTDANSFDAMGRGYAWLAAAQLLVDRPDDRLKFHNGGISGDKVYQLADRWQADCLDLRPDVLSILVGVNDFWHKHKHGYEGTIDKYETDYRALLQRTKDALPNVKLVVCEPFVLKVGAVDDTWFPEFDAYRAAARDVAQEAGATFVPFQTMFDRAAKLAPPDHWAADGVHPTTHGAALMAHFWLRTVGACKQTSRIIDIPRS